MIPSFLIFIAIAAGSITETPFLAVDLAKSISHCKCFDWTKMNDEDGNIRYTITFYKMPDFASSSFEKKLLQQHRKKNCSNDNINKKNTVID